MIHKTEYGNLPKIAASAHRGKIYAELRSRLSDGDESHLQSVLARHGPALLDRGVPYLLVAVRNERIGQWRKEHREVPSEFADEVSPIDPAGQVMARTELRAAVDGLKQLEERDAWLLWWSAEGYDLSEIVERWDGAGFEPSGPSRGYLRTRRSRARARLGEVLKASGYRARHDQ